METPSRPRPHWNAQLLADDMGAKGWMMTDLAREAVISNKTVTLFFQGERQTAKTVRKMAKALGRPISRYLVRQAVAA